MTAYSGTPVHQKLGIKAGDRVAFVHAPPSFAQTIGTLPGDVRAAPTLAGEHPLDVIVLFVTFLRELERDFASALHRLHPAGGLWVAWPKKASRVDTDLNENIIREHALLAGMVDNKVCAIDDTWSGLRLVIRVENRRKDA